jgi:hypothetical protein
MSDNQENSQSTTFGTIGLLANNNPLAVNTSKDEDDQQQIKDLESESITPIDQNQHRRKSILDNEEADSTPAMMDTSNHQPLGTIRSTMSESTLMVASESLPTLPIQQDENSTDDDSQHAIVQSEFAERSQAQNRSRVQSASNKRPVRTSV